MIVRVVVALACVVAVYLCWPRGADIPPPNTAKGAARHVDPALCAECHEEQQDKWVGSHHRLAMQRATDATVLGDFYDAEFEAHGTVSRFFRRDGRFFVRTEGPDGAPAEFEVLYTFGVDPLQQYLVEIEEGRVQCLLVAWDVAQERWFHLQDERIEPGDPLHWTGRRYNWNFACADCHSTGLKRNYDAETRTYRTTWDEIHVGCQSCHGPGSRHVAWAREIERTDADYPLDDPRGLVVRLKDRDPAVEVEACARCHSRRIPLTDAFRHDRPFLDSYEVRLLEPGLYHANGRIDDEVFVYGSFLQSKMYRHGVRCSDCHDSHSGGMKLVGNLACVRCHKTEPPEQFETLKAKDYDTPAHHFHKPGTAGSACVDCHMPAKTYMTVDPRRDHGFSIPQPDLTLSIGTPNACDDCHGDKGAQWAADELEKRGLASAQLPPPFAPAIAAARAGHPQAGLALAFVAGNEEYNGIVRATAVSMLPRFLGPEVLRAVAEAASDDDPLVRGAAAGALEVMRIAARAKAQVLGPLLSDRLRSVRVAAAHAMTTLPEAERRAATAFDAALRELRERQLAMADQPGSHLNLGVIEANLGNFGEAERAYLHALSLDDRFQPARLNLAQLYARMGQPERSEEVLRRILEFEPANGETHYSLGLLLAEQKRFDEAAHHLGAAADALPQRARVRYNHALALQHAGNRDQAEAALLAADGIDAHDPDILHAIVIFYAQDERWKDALPFARRLAARLPRAAGPTQLVAQIERELENG